MKLDFLTKKNISTSITDSLLHPLNDPPELDILGHEFITGDTVLLFSCPPTMKMTLNNLKRVNVIGLTSNFVLNTNKIMIPATELNMKHEYFIPGRINNTLNFSRILTSENNLLHVFYKWLTEYLETAFKDNISFLEKPYGNNKKHMPTLGSELFLVPFGLVLIELDGLENFVAGFFAENCKLLNYSIGINDSPVVIENVNIQCQAILPIDDKLKPKFKEVQPYQAVLKRNLVQNNTVFPNENIVKDESKKQEQKEEEKKKKEEKDRSKSILAFTNKRTVELDNALRKSWNNFQNTIFPERRGDVIDKEKSSFNNLA